VAAKVATWFAFGEEEGWIMTLVVEEWCNDANRKTLLAM